MSEAMKTIGICLAAFLWALMSITRCLGLQTGMPSVDPHQPQRGIGYRPQDPFQDSDRRMKSRNVENMCYVEELDDGSAKGGLCSMLPYAFLHYHYVCH